MSSPILVRAYNASDRTPAGSPRTQARIKALPPVSSFAFAEILRSADSPEFQSAVDGIADIAAKTRMSLADEYASHLPPLGEITAAGPVVSRPQTQRFGRRRALTSVPEGSSAGSEGSRSSKGKGKQSSFSLLRRQRLVQLRPDRTVRIGSMGRTLSVQSTTAMAVDLDAFNATRESPGPGSTALGDPRPERYTGSPAKVSLQRLLRTHRVEGEP